MNTTTGTLANPSPQCRPLHREGTARLDDPFQLASGAIVQNLELAYTLTGPEHAPVIGVLGGISADRNPADSPRAPGWWPGIVGPEKALDTNRFRILSFDYLGGFGGSTGQRALARQAGNAFHPIGTEDQADALAALLEKTGIPALEIMVGASYGGMVGLAFAARHPGRAKCQIAICAADRSLPHAIAWREIQRRIAILGLDHDCPDRALDLARQVAMLTFRTPAELNRRFQAGLTDPGDSRSITGYLSHQGRKFATHRTPREFLCLSHSIDGHRVDVGAIRTETHLVGSTTDQLVPLRQLRVLRSRFGGACTLHAIDSIYGHDAFLKEPDRLTAILEKIIATRTRNHQDPVPEHQRRKP